METTVNISNGRIVKISCRIEFEKEEAKNFANETASEHKGEDLTDWADKILLNDKPFFKVRTGEIVILSTAYTPEATVLSGYDWKRINESINDLKEKFKAEPYTLLEYFS